MLNIGSLLLGIIAWFTPILAMRVSFKKCVNYIIFSFSACIASLCLQLFEINHRVQMKDFSALMDTIGALVWVASILGALTILLNVTAWIVCTKKQTKNQTRFSIKE